MQVRPVLAGANPCHPEAGAKRHFHQLMTPEELQTELIKAQRDDDFYRILTEDQLSYISARWDRAHGLASCWEREWEDQEIAATRARLKRWGVILGIACVLWGIYCHNYYEAAAEAREKLEWLFQEGAKDPAVKSFLERVDKQRAEYYQSLKDDESNDAAEPDAMDHHLGSCPRRCSHLDRAKAFEFFV